MTGKYILDGHTPRLVDDVVEWSKWFECADRIVKKTEFGEVMVSTVFLGLDHSFGNEPPMLFESMVFGGPLSDEVNRYSTWEQAMAGHNDMVDRVRQTLN